MLFDIGEPVTTRAIFQKMENEPDFKSFVSYSLKQYSRGEWGNLPDEDKAANDAATKDGGRIIARYNHNIYGDIYIMTEADRTYTTILFCNEF